MQMHRSSSCSSRSRWRQNIHHKRWLLPAASLLAGVACVGQFSSSLVKSQLASKVYSLVEPVQVLRASRLNRKSKDTLAAFESIPSSRWLAGTVSHVTNYGAFVTVTALDGKTMADGLLHATEFHNGSVADVANSFKVGQRVLVRVIHVDPKRVRMSLSMKDFFNSTARAVRVGISAFKHVPSDQWLSGQVARTTDFGAFVTLTTPDGEATVEGLVHVSQLRDGFVENVEEEVAVGQSVQVRIINVDTNHGKLDLSMRQNLDSNVRPAHARANLSAFKGISPNEWLSGTVARLLPFGAVVTVSEPNGKATAPGLLHVAQLSNTTFVKDVADEVDIGQSLKVRIITVDTQIGRLDLSMRDGLSGNNAAVHVPADITAFEDIPSDQWLPGKVSRITAFGAVITVIAPSGKATAEGLLHISDISGTATGDVAHAVKVGQRVMVRIIKVNLKKDRMWLSMKDVVDSSASTVRTPADFTAPEVPYWLDSYMQKQHL